MALSARPLQPTARTCLMSSAHPVASLANLALPSANTASAALLSTPGLELTYNARGALLAAFTEIARLGRRKVLLPAFHCPSAITPALMAGLSPVYYRIRPDLGIDADDVLSKADRNTAAILLIHFFGFAPAVQALAPLADLGIQRVEDCSHSYVAADTLRLAGSEHSEYRIYSFWKIVPSGVGGGIWRRSPADHPKRRPAPATLRLRNYKRLLEESIHRSGNPLLKTLLQGADGLRTALRPAPSSAEAAPEPELEHGETHYPVHANLAGADMPASVRRIIAAADLAAIVQARRANFKRYQLSAFRLRPMQLLATQLPDATCPWVYPVLLNDRSRWDQRMRDAGVALHTFGIYLHSSLFADRDPKVIQDARFLAERMLCLSIHQDLSEADIERHGHLIEATLSSATLP